MLKDKDLKPGTYFAVNSYKKHKPHQFHHINVIAKVIDNMIICEYICLKDNNIVQPSFLKFGAESAFEKGTTYLHKLSKKEVHDLNKWLVFQ